MQSIQPTSLQSFITPPANSYYLNPASLNQVARVFDQNRDGVIGRDELRVSPQLLRQLDRNRDNLIQLFEFESGLVNNQVSVQQLAPAVSHQIAQVLIADRIFSAGLGSLGQVVDSNYDGFVTRQELGMALNTGRVILSGSYLVAPHQPNQPNWPPAYPPNPGYPGGPGQVPGGPGYPPYPGMGKTVEQTRAYISELESNKMRKDSWGNNDPSTGIFTPEEANAKIRKFLEDEVVNSSAMSLKDKLEIFKSQRMKKDSWGNDDPAKGSVSGKQASDLAEKAAKASQPNPFERDFAKNYIDTLSGEKMKPDSWGNDDYSSGLYTPAQANTLIKAFIRSAVLDSREMSRDEKLALIRSQTMKKDSWGNDNPRTGSLTTLEAQQLSKEVFESNAGFQSFKAAA